MAVKIAPALGLFIVICVLPGLKSSQLVPDGLVYTEVKKTLVQGVQGFLTCRFNGDPLTVYWRKGLDPDDLSPMVIWYDGEVSGPRFDDGSCEVDENYSLIINNVSTTDAGRIYCTVSFNKGPPMQNFTDLSVVGLKSSEVVPDGPVYTEVKKTLVQGVQGVLTCRFNGDPLTVYWRKGLDPDDLSPMVIWYDGEVSGPRFDDGSCDVDENYSLIINNVSTTDAGRIYCTVTFNKGPLMQNYTDLSVVDTVITTDPQVTLQLRQATYGILQCTVHIKARRVSWKKGSTSSANESLVVIENNQGVAERSGAGYDEGMYDITEDYSLVIKELQIHHEGLYVCEVTDDTGISFRNHTFVNVVAHPLEPFPTIQECMNAEQNGLNDCTLVAKSGMTLTCQAVEYYPSINLVFLYGLEVLEPLHTREWNNTDGTKNKTVTISTRGNKELYTCVAYSIPGTNAKKSTSVSPEHGDKPVKSTVVIILVLFAALILISSAVYFIWRKKYGNYSAIPLSAPLRKLEDSHPPVPPVKFSSLPRSDLHQELKDFDVKDLTQKELQALDKCVSRVLIEHYREIHDAIETESFEAEKIITENCTALFDTHQMLNEWQQRPTSTSSQYMRAYQHAYTVADKSGPASDHAWPTEEELQWISRHLTLESMEEICNELQIAYRYDDAKDEEKRFDSLCEWRSKASDKPLEEKWKQLTLVLKSNNLAGLLPNLKGPHIYKAELVDLAFHLLIHDLCPVAEALGINVTQLASYRPAFQPSHLDIGTIKLLIELREYCKRSVFCNKIANLHYRNVAFTGLVDYGMSYGELCSISKAINQDADACADQGILPEIPEELGNLQDVLQLTDQDIADRFDTSHSLTAYELFKIWKEKPRSSVFNYRASLAHELRRIQMFDHADEIISGKYITEETSLAFIDDMVRGLNQDQIRSLGELLQLTGGKQNWHTTTPFNDIIKQIYDWVADWTSGRKDYLPSKALPLVNPRMKATAEEYRDLNDKLVEHGFLDLAREIMIIELQYCNSIFEPLCNFKNDLG